MSNDIKRIGGRAYDQATPPTAKSSNSLVEGMFDLYGRLATYLGTSLDATNDSITNYSGASSTVAGVDTIYQAALTNSVVGVKTSTGRLFGWDLSAGGSVTAEYVQIFDLNTTSVTLGTTVPKLSIMIPIANKDEKAFTIPITFATAISVAATATAGGSGAPATTINANWFYK